MDAGEMDMQATDDGMARAELNALFDELDNALRCLLTQLQRGFDSCRHGEPAPRPDGFGAAAMRPENRGA